MRLRSRQSSTASVGTSEAIYRRALAVFEECFGPVHYEVAATLHNLAAVLVTKRNYQEAEENYRRALSIKERLLGADSPDVALTRSEERRVGKEWREGGGREEGKKKRRK